MTSSSSSAVSVVEVYGKKQGWHDLQRSLNVCFGVLCEPPVSVSLYLVRFRLALRGGGSHPGTDGRQLLHYLMDG
ncbi:hypothetical protein NDU88_002724 [Pleurodeles waltl]|uniref:Uncharacterized protein n=1 Tax=Pleurodeles waltl TaxID=8319 RepID=A0AAV7QAQ2_PLEWA|nr:hypothetical protein NDU88_002724 [Pleurodeles waltl]